MIQGVNAWFLCCSILLVISISAQADELADYRKELTLFSLKATGPLLDGRLDDRCWNDAHVQKAKGFIRLMDAGKIEPASADTEVMSCYDDECVYLAVRAHEPAMNKLKVYSRTEPWEGDCIEVFIGPAGEGQSYFHFIVDTAENTYNGVNEQGQEQAISFEWAAKCLKSTNSWTVEMALPFASLGCAAPKDNQRWDFNVGRERYTQKEMSSWAALGEFTQRRRFGKLAFFSRHEIVADIAYWENSDADPLLRRKEVSGIKIADRFLKDGDSAEKRIPDLWSYFPYEADRGEKRENGNYHDDVMRGLSEKAKAVHPEFYRAAVEINGLLIQKSFLDEKLRAAQRAAYYAGRIAAGNSQDSNPAGQMKGLQRRNHLINADLNDLYQFYGRAFDANRNAERLSGVHAKANAIAELIQGLESDIGACIDMSSAGVIKKAGPWKSRILELRSEEQYLNDSGTSCRYQFTAFSSAHTEHLSRLGPFDRFHIDWPVPWPKSDTPGEYNFPKLRGYIEKIHKESSGRIESFSCTEPSYRGALYPMTHWMLEKAGKDPDIILQTEKDKKAPVESEQFVIDIRSRLNPHHPAALEYIRGYLKRFAVELSTQVKTDYFVTAWEGSASHVGYNPSSRAAFRDYLKERYRSVASLNGKWKTEYASFESIKIPYDQYTSPAREVSGLTYEFERWGRLNYIRLMARMRQFLREGAPNVPVMPDLSHFLREGNTYLMYRENTCDIMSFHSRPGLEEPMWVYLETMNRAFGKITGYFENYFGMWPRANLNDERLAKRDLDKFFFELFMRDVRVSTWWLTTVTGPIAYAAAYNANSFRLEYGQSIYRWSATSLPVMFRKCRSIEKALLESGQEIPKTAIIQPCATVFNLASMNHDSNDSDTLRLMFDLHNRLLSPGNVAHDYLPEEMVLDGKGSLDDYTVLFLPYAPYMSEEFSRRLTRWVEKGGTLIAIGPFSLKNEFGLDPVGGESMFTALFPKYKKIGEGNWDYSVDGTDQKPEPAVTTKSFGKGRIVCLNRMVDMLLRHPSLGSLLTKIVNEMCEQTAMSPNSDLRILVRDGNRGEKYLALCNDRVEDSIETNVLVKGHYDRPKDITVPGWFPVPSRIVGNQTELMIRLEPGEWTMIALEERSNQ